MSEAQLTLKSFFLIKSDLNIHIFLRELIIFSCGFSAFLAVAAIEEISGINTFQADIKYNLTQEGFKDTIVKWS